MYNITDPEVRLLAIYSGSLRDQYGKTFEINTAKPMRSGKEVLLHGSKPVLPDK